MKAILKLESVTVMANESIWTVRNTLENISKINLTAEVNFNPILRYLQGSIFGRMESGSKANGRMESFMGRALRPFQMGQSSMVTGRRDDLTGRVCANIPTAPSTPAVGITVSRTVSESRSCRMEPSIQETGLTVRLTA